MVAYIFAVQKYGHYKCPSIKKLAYARMRAQAITESRITVANTCTQVVKMSSEFTLTC